MWCVTANDSVNITSRARSRFFLWIVAALILVAATVTTNALEVDDDDDDDDDDEDDDEWSRKLVDLFILNTFQVHWLCRLEGGINMIWKQHGRESAVEVLFKNLSASAEKNEDSEGSHLAEPFLFTPISRFIHLKTVVKKAERRGIRQLLRQLCSVGSVMRKLKKIRKGWNSVEPCCLC
jgi:hypothetical protein